MDERILRLKKQMQNDFKHDWTLEELAQTINVSAAHLQKLFKNQTGTSPIQYLRDWRLEKARQLLETKFYRLKQIGLEVGMPNDSHFTRDFKKKYGLTPTEYRKRYWEKIQAERSESKR